MNTSPCVQILLPIKMCSLSYKETGMSQDTFEQQCEDISAYKSRLKTMKSTLYPQHEDLKKRFSVGLLDSFGILV